MKAWAIPDAACGPAMAPLPAAIVEKIRTCRKVHVDGRSDDACAASDLRHAAVGIARQRFETSVEDGRDAAFRVGAAAPGGGRFGRCS